MKSQKTITVVSGCYNEEKNLEELTRRVWSVAETFPQYKWEYIIIDNDSTDASQQILRKMAAADPRLKVILNTRNFGHIRSPFYGMLQATGDAMVYLASDLQDPPELISQFILKWEEGWKVVAAVKNKSEEGFIFFAVRKVYYRLIGYLAEIDLLRDFTGFGLYDQVVVEHLRELEDPYHYHRGIISRQSIRLEWGSRGI